MKILITGIAGSGGSYMAENLLSKGFEVCGFIRWHSTTTKQNLEKIENKIDLHECDLNDLGSVIRTLNLIKPELIYNLAAHANVHVCFSNPISVIENNIKSSLNLFEAIRILKLKSVVLHASTSEVYGLVKKIDCPISEEHPENPINPYSVSKLTQEKLAYSYWHSFGIETLITRAFTYLNPRREDLFASSFAKQVVEIENGQREVLEHGNLDSVRTILDVRDMCEAYFQASMKCNFRRGL